MEGGWELQFTPPFPENPENPENPEDSGGEFLEARFDAQVSRIRRFGPEKVVHIWPWEPKGAQGDQKTSFSTAD